MKQFKQIIMETFDQNITETKQQILDLSPYVKTMKRYSHDKNSYGFLDKELNSGVNHKTIHNVAKNAGYFYTSKHQNKINNKDMTYHIYQKSGGHGIDHILTVITPEDSGKVWNIEHKIIKDYS